MVEEEDDDDDFQLPSFVTKRDKIVVDDVDIDIFFVCVIISQLTPSIVANSSLVLGESDVR
jgi:hypothetical protein